MKRELMKWFSKRLGPDLKPITDRIDKLEKKVEGIIKTLRSSVTGQHLVLGTIKDPKTDIYHQLFEDNRESDDMYLQRLKYESKIDCNKCTNRQADNVDTIEVGHPCYNCLGSCNEVEMIYHHTENNMHKLSSEDNPTDEEYCDDPECPCQGNEKPKNPISPKIFQQMEDKIKEYNSKRPDHTHGASIPTKIYDSIPKSKVKLGWTEGKPKKEKSTNKKKKFVPYPTRLTLEDRLSEGYNKKIDKPKDSDFEDRQKEILDMFHYIQENKKLNEEIEHLKSENKRIEKLWVERGITILEMQENQPTNEECSHSWVSLSGDFWKCYGCDTMVTERPKKEKPKDSEPKLPCDCGEVHELYPDDILDLEEKENQPTNYILTNRDGSHSELSYEEMQRLYGVDFEQDKKLQYKEKPKDSEITMREEFPLTYNNLYELNLKMKEEIERLKKYKSENQDLLTQIGQLKNENFRLKSELDTQIEAGAYSSKSCNDLREENKQLREDFRVSVSEFQKLCTERAERIKQLETELQPQKVSKEERDKRFERFNEE